MILLKNICFINICSLLLFRSFVLLFYDMKIAISSTGNNLESALDRRFGRCSYFVVHDTETRATEFIPNPNKDSLEGAGPASVTLVASRGVKKVVSGEFGTKVKSIFDSLQIQLIALNEPEKKIGEIIDLLNHKE
jgi:predicted Fe-Mo cluster-binding NifX family protein